MKDELTSKDADTFVCLDFIGRMTGGPLEMSHDLTILYWTAALTSRLENVKVQQSMILEVQTDRHCNTTLCAAKTLWYLLSSFWL